VLDGETSYFYLYENQGGVGRKVFGAIHIVTGVPGFEESDILVSWNAPTAETKTVKVTPQ